MTNLQKNRKNVMIYGTFFIAKIDQMSCFLDKQLFILLIIRQNHVIRSCQQTSAKVLNSTQDRGKSFVFLKFFFLDKKNEAIQASFCVLILYSFA